MACGGDGDLLEGSIPIPIASLVREHRATLEAQGSTVHKLPGWSHGVCIAPKRVVTAMRRFLDLRL
jgi:hypothetical protein